MLVNVVVLYILEGDRWDSIQVTVAFLYKSLYNMSPLPPLRRNTFLHADGGGPVRDAEAPHLGLSLVAGDGGEPALVFSVLGVDDLDCGRGVDKDDEREDGGGGEAENTAAADPHGALPAALSSLPQRD